MKLIQFRAINYKSIQDSGHCSLADDMTIFVGKNESGKTALLEALQDFDAARPAISESARRLMASKNELPAIEMTFQLSSAELYEIEKESGSTFPENIRQILLREGVRLEKTFSGEYKLKSVDPVHMPDGVPLYPAVDASLTGELPAHIQIYENKKKLSEMFPGISTPEIILNRGPEVLQKCLNELRVIILDQLVGVHDEKKKGDAVELIRAISKSAKTLDPKSAEANPQSSFIKSLTARMPRFVFFNDQEDMLPFEIPLAAVKQNQAVQDLARIAGLDLDELLATEDLQSRINLLNRHTAVIAADFLGHWDQNKIELVIQISGEKLVIGAKEKEGTDFFKIKQRSNGFQWFLSFYLKINRYKASDIVVLMDEMGMNLHPVAQKDILKMLKQLSGADMQIIFSTHSPFMIDVDRLDRIRFVIKDKIKGSTLKQIDQDAVDRETFMPVRAAIACQAEIDPAVFNMSLDSKRDHYVSDIKAQLAGIKEKLDKELQESEPVFSTPVVSELETQKEFTDPFGMQEARQEIPPPVEQEKSGVLIAKPNAEPARKKSSGLFGWFGKKKK